MDISGSFLGRIKAWVDTEIATHKTIADAHHAAYTDAQVNAKILTHKNIGDAHHAAYTDAAAIAATKNLKYGFYVNRLSQQAIPNDTITKIEHDSEIFDIHNDYNTTTHRFVAPVNGYYTLHANAIFLSVVTDSKLMVMLYINGAIRAVGRLVTNLTSLHGISVSLVYKMAANDYADVRVYHTFGVAKYLYGSGNTGYNQFSGGILGEY